MRRMVKALLFSLLICQPIMHMRLLQAGRDGGAAVAGALGGLAVGTMIGSATSRDSRADRRVDELQRDQMRILERDLDRQAAQKDPWFTILIGLVFMMFIAVVGLGILVLKKN